MLATILLTAYITLAISSAIGAAEIVFYDPEFSDGDIWGKIGTIMFLSIFSPVFVLIDLYGLFPLL